MERLAIGEALDRIALGMGEREAAVFLDQHVRWRYRDLHARVSQVAKGLMGIGVDGGDRVGLFATNLVEWLLVQLAVAKIGAVLVPIDPAAGAADLAHVFTDAGVSTLFLVERVDDVSLVDVLIECCPEAGTGRPGHIPSRRFPLLKRVALLGADAGRGGMLAWSDVLGAGAGITDHLLRRRQEEVQFEDLAAIQYTAGSTGAPKGVELTHHAIVQNALAVGDCMRLVRGDRLCVPVPFVRPLGSVLGVLAALTRGATLVVPAEHFDAEKTLTAIAAERCTALHAEPRMLGSLVRHPDVLRTDASSLRTGLVMGAPIPVGLMEQVAARLRVPELTVGYGPTDTTGIVTQTRTEDGLDLRATTVGRALPSLEVKIVDPTTGVEVATGVEGELCCRGYAVMRGYYGSPEATAAKLGRNGWLRTGDRAVTDRFGYCTLTGRIDA